jgi:beta-lactamase regulating signal transducer with metallopeptidase domain
MMPLMRETGGTRPARGRVIGTVLSLLIHLVVLLMALTFAPHVRQIVALDTVDRGTAGGGTIDAGDASGVAGAGTGGAARSTGMGVWLRRVADALVAFAELVQVPRLRFAMEKLLDHLWQSTLFAIAAGLLAIACRRNRARVRYALWLGASIKFFIPFALLTALGSQLAWPRALAKEIRQPIISAAIAPATWVVAATSPAAPSHARDGRGLALLGIWGCGCLAIVSTRIRMWRRVRETLDASTPMELSGIETPASMQVRSAPGVLEPGVVGWREPVLLMPADIDQHLTTPEIEAIVAHELCHIRRYDNLTAAMHMAVEAVFWFHPLVWWIGGRLIDERECACDEDVLCRISSPRDYARGILNVCKRYIASPLASVSGVGSANVRTRIDAILANRVGEAIGWSKRLALSTAMASAVFVPLAVGAMQAASLAPPLRRPFTVTSYALVLADADGRLGPNLTRSPRTDCDVLAPNVPPCGTYVATLDAGLIAADSITLSQLADLISGAMNQNVEDRTSLTGHFNVELMWNAAPSGRGFRAPFLVEAVREQLGLRLEPVLSREQ